MWRKRMAPASKVMPNPSLKTPWDLTITCAVLTTIRESHLTMITRCRCDRMNQNGQLPGSGRSVRIDAPTGTMNVTMV